MNRFQSENLNHIKTKIQQETNIQLHNKKQLRSPKATIVFLAALLLSGLCLTAFGFQRFSDLAGDELSLGAAYLGNGVVSIQIDNKSEKELHFQPKLKLMQWNTGEEILPLSRNITFTNTEIPAHSQGTMTVDLSKAYDITMLEQPLTDDTYYFVLTNNNFIFGQDWMCSVAFTETIHSPEKPAAASKTSESILEQIPQSLRFYFTADSSSTEDRRKLNDAYKEAYGKLFADFDGNIVSSVSPILPGNKISTDMPRLSLKDPAPDMVFDDNISAKEQYLLTGLNWHSGESRFKLLATEGEYALVISAALPLETYKDASTELPLLFLLTYEKDKITGENDYAFVYGQIIPFTALESHQVYEDETYVCYEVSPFIYTDLDGYLQDFAKGNPTVRLDEDVKSRVEHIYNYYRENLPDLLYFQ